LQVQFHTDDVMSYNTIAEIPGTDLKDQIVMLGAHMDSWHSGTGATDNGAGVAVTMEAVRILQAAKLQPRRTIRIALWTGEEEGLYGSKAYVAAHFGKNSTNAAPASLASGPIPNQAPNPSPENPGPVQLCPPNLKPARSTNSSQRTSTWTTARERSGASICKAMNPPGPCFANG